MYDKVIHERSADGTPLLQVRRLVKEYTDRAGVPFRAVDDVSFTVDTGRALALVGESGSGKSTTARCALRLIRADSGSVHLDGEEILTASASRFRAIRRKAQLIFQDPFSSLDPRVTVGGSIAEGLEIHRLAGGRITRKQRVGELLELVGLHATHADRYPKEFSGGQRQRIGIARALAVEPRLLFCDEPIASLDVSIQAQILNLLADLKEQLDLTIVFIAHDLATVRFLCDHIVVMNRGAVVEDGPTDAVLANPGHPYTRELLAAVPIADPVRERARRAERLGTVEA